MSDRPTLTALNRFPVKSCRGESLRTATIEPWGLHGDRRWMLVDDDGETVTAREHPRLLLVAVSITEAGLHLHHPDLGDLDVLDIQAPAPATVPVSVFGGAPFPATPAGAAAAAWFGELLAVRVRLVHVADPTRRPVNPAFSRPGDCAAFQDGYPVTLASEDSLAALNGWIATGPRAAEGPLPMIRFRPNLVVSGAAPFAEDGWRRVGIGAAEFRVAKGCARCAIPTTDHGTAARGHEPTLSLARHRRFDGKVWFATNLIPDTPGATVRVGDPLQVLEAEPVPNGPRR
ncbi:MAG: MOSC domain-containing protein [Jatrophihabitans sp.]|nr:MAG: MOSC domain-containing protein [Jatrophihabitans sp.]